MLHACYLAMLLLHCLFPNQWCVCGVDVHWCKCKQDQLFLCMTFHGTVGVLYAYICILYIYMSQNNLLDRVYLWHLNHTLSTKRFLFLAPVFRIIHWHRLDICTYSNSQTGL